MRPPHSPSLQENSLRVVVVILESSLNMDQGPDMDLDEPPSRSSATASSHKMKGQGQFVEPLGDKATMPIAQGADKARDSSSLV